MVNFIANSAGGGLRQSYLLAKHSVCFFVKGGAFQDPPGSTTVIGRISPRSAVCAERVATASFLGLPGLKYGSHPLRITVLHLERILLRDFTGPSLVAYPNWIGRVT